MPMKSSSSPSPKAVHKLVVAILHSHSGSELGLDHVVPDTPLIDGGLGLDSIDLLKSILQIEEAVNLRLREEDMTEDVFATVGGLANHVCQKLAMVNGGGSPKGC